MVKKTLHYSMNTGILVHVWHFSVKRLTPYGREEGVIPLSDITHYQTKSPVPGVGQWYPTDLSLI